MSHIQGFIKFPWVLLGSKVPKAFSNAYHFLQWKTTTLLTESRETTNYRRRFHSPPPGGTRCSPHWDKSKPIPTESNFKTILPLLLLLEDWGGAHPDEIAGLQISWLRGGRLTNSKNLISDAAGRQGRFLSCSDPIQFNHQPAWHELLKISLCSNFFFIIHLYYYI